MIKSFFINKWLILLLCIVVPLKSPCQYLKQYSCDLHYTWFGCDYFGSIYALVDNYFLKIKGPCQDTLRYDLEKNGIPGYIDVNNPEKLVIYFKNTNKLILLDSTLNELIRPFYLIELGIDNTSMIFSTTDNGIWYYYDYNNSLTKLNKDFIPVVQSLSLNPWFQPPSRPTFITTYKDKIYLNIPSNGILVLGKYGEYVTSVNLPGLIDFQVLDDNIYYYSDHVVYCYNLKLQTTRKIYLPYENDIRNAWFFNDKLILLHSNGYSVYKYEPQIPN